MNKAFPSLEKWQQSKIKSVLQHNLQLLLILLLTIALILSIYRGNQQKVLLVPLIGKPLTMQNDEIDSGYGKQLALSLSLLLGNVQPGNLSYLQNNLSYYLTPQLYAIVMNHLEQQAQHITSQQLSIWFTPQNIEQVNKQQVNVNGISYTKTIDGSTSQTKVSYQFTFVQSNYLLQVTSFKLSEEQ